MLSPDDAPKLIPRVIHQTFKSGAIPADLQPLMQSWRTLNPGWDIRFYDDKVGRGLVSEAGRLREGRLLRSLQWLPRTCSHLVSSGLTVQLACRPAWTS